MTTPTIFPPLTEPLPFYYAALTCVWVYFRVDQAVVTRYLSEVTLELGDSSHPMRAALERVLARPSVLAVQQYAAPPIGAVGRPFYVDG